jgi:hypothetical protein
LLLDQSSRIVEDGVLWLAFEAGDAILMKLNDLEKRGTGVPQGYDLPRVLGNLACVLGNLACVLGNLPGLLGNLPSLLCNLPSLFLTFVQQKLNGLSQRLMTLGQSIQALVNCHSST